MKARVKGTGNIIDVEWCGHNSMGAIYTDVTHTQNYYEYELDFNTVYDYWVRLEHQYAGMAMQGMVSNTEMFIELGNNKEKLSVEYAIAEASFRIAHALVEKLKEESK